MHTLPRLCVIALAWMLASCDASGPSGHEDTHVASEALPEARPTPAAGTPLTFEFDVTPKQADGAAIYAGFRYVIPGGDAWDVALDRTLRDLEHAPVLGRVRVWRLDGDGAHALAPRAVRQHLVGEANRPSPKLVEGAFSTHSKQSVDTADLDPPDAFDRKLATFEYAFALFGVTSAGRHRIEVVFHEPPPPVGHHKPSVFVAQWHGSSK